MLLRRLISRRQHTLGTDAVPAGRIVNQHMGYRSNKPSILENRAAAHSLADHKLYADEAYKETVTKAEIEDAVKKGRLVIVEGANYLIPIAFGATGAVTVTAGDTVKTQAWAASDPA